MFWCNGGQNQNKRHTGVRIVHKESGAVGESREERSQLQNKKTALRRLSETAKFRLWVYKKVNEIDTGKSIEQKVDELMNMKNIKIEENINNQWVEINMD